MKKILFFLAFLAPAFLFSQDIINLDARPDSTWTTIETDTLYLAKDSIYITSNGDTLKIISDTVMINGTLLPVGAYTSNVIDLSNITIDYTGSSGPAPFRIGTYGNPLLNADEDQSGMLRLYGQTSADGSSYDRGVFVALKTTGTKSIFPIAGLAEVLAQSGAGPTSVAGGQFIADLHTTDAVLAATTGGGEGMYGSWFKVTAIDGATTNANSIVAPIWVDNQLYGNNASTTNKEYGIRATTGGTVPKSFIGFETSSDGWGQLLYFDATAYDHQPVSNTSLKVMLNTTQYYLPLSTSSTSFTWGYPITLNGSSTYGLNLSGGTYSTADFIGQNSATINNSDANTVSLSVNSVEAARFVESTTTQLLVGDGTAALPSMAFINDSHSGFYSCADNDIAVTLSGSAKWLFDGVVMGSINNGRAALYGIVPTATAPVLLPSHTTDVNTGIGWAGADQLSLIAGGVEGIRIAEGGGKIKVSITDTLAFDNGAYISNEETDTLKITETVTKIEGDLVVTGHCDCEKSGALTYISTPGTQTIGTAGTFERLNEGAIAYTSAHLYNFTHDDGRLTYTGTPTIHVTITVAIAAESGETAQVTNFRIAKGGTTIAATDMPITFTALDQAANTPLKWLDTAATNEYWEIFGTSDTNADEFDINTLVFTITEH